MIDALTLLGILALIIFLIRLKWNLGLALLLASVLAGLLFSLPALDLGREMLTAAIDTTTLRLVAIVLLITYMGEILRTALQLEGLVRSLSDLFLDRRWLLGLLPLLIGLLPMVGGAMFSAPMVEEAGQGLNLSRERKTYVNYWFRHACETAFPLYPSLVMASGLMGVSTQALALSNWPLLAAVLASGIVFGLLGVQRIEPDGGVRPSSRATWLLLVKSIWPIALVLILALAVHLDLVLSLGITVLVLVLAHRLKPRQLWVLLKKMPFDVVPIIFGAMIFQRVLTASSAVEIASRGIAALGIPVPIVVLGIPLLAGLLTGLAVAGFAIGLPIVLPLCPPELIGTGYSLLAYTGGILGLLLSPVHVCLALSRAYFRASWAGVYRYLLPSALVVIAVAAAVTLIRS